MAAPRIWRRLTAYPLPPMARGLADLVLPVTCAGCALPGPSLCPECRTVLGCASAEPWSPTPAPQGLPSTWSTLAYEGVVRSCVVAWKDQDRFDLTRVFSPVLARGLHAAVGGRASLRSAVLLDHPVYVVAVPSARSGTARRGRWPVRDVVRRTLRATGRGSTLQDLPALSLSRRVADQAGLGAGERWSNLRGAMTVPTRHTATVRGAVVVVVDDVVTSGATLAEAGRALRCAGAADVVAVTLAATRRRRAGASTGLDHALAGDAV